MHNPAFKAKNLDCQYEAIPCPPDQIAEVIQKLKSDKFKGWNCTVPLKEDIIPFLDFVDKEALACQSVNTVVVQENGELHGFSTDGYGLEKAIEEDLGIQLTGKHILMIGAGGAARAPLDGVGRGGGGARGEGVPMHPRRVQRRGQRRRHGRHGRHPARPCRAREHGLRRDARHGGGGVGRRHGGAVLRAHRPDRHAGQHDGQGQVQRPGQPR